MKRTLVVGDLNVDIIASGMSLFPELGREILCSDIRTVLGGSASIFASRLAQLGAKVDILGKVGNDEYGRTVLNALKSNGVGIDKVIVGDDLRTGVTISLTYPENKALITFMGSIGALERSDVKPEDFKDYDHLHVSSIYLQPKLLNFLAEMFAEAKKQGLITSLDPQCDPQGEYKKIWGILKHTDIFLPNDNEAMDITGTTNVSNALKKLSLKVKVVVIKCGCKGAVGMANDETVNVEAFRIKPIDTTGAGDSFDAGFIYYFIHKNKSLRDSITFANAVGGLACLYIGGAEGKITEDEALNFIMGRRAELLG